MSDKSPYTDHLESVDQFGQVVPLFPNSQAGEAEQPDFYEQKLAGFKEAERRKVAKVIDDAVSTLYAESLLLGDRDKNEITFSFDGFEAFVAVLKLRLPATPAPAGDVEERTMRLPGLLKRKRLELGESQTEFAQRFGKESATAVSLWESGKRDIPQHVTEWLVDELLAARQQSADEVRRELLTYLLANAYISSGEYDELFAKFTQREQ